MQVVGDSSIAEPDGLTTGAGQRLIHELIEIGAITPDRVAAGLCVIGAWRRGRVWFVRTPNGPSYVVKQASDPTGQRLLAREAVVYSHLRGVERCHGPFLPELTRYDEQRGLLIIDYVDGASLGDIITRRGRARTTPAAVLGRTLARVHQAGIEQVDPSLNITEPPWVLSIHRPDLRWHTHSSEASLEMHAEIQQRPELTSALDRLRGELTATALIHADLKLEHVIASRAPSRMRPAISIIDWELAQLGDPAWDIGAIFAEYLLRWLRSIPLVAGRMPVELAAIASTPLQRVQPSVNAFWQAYAREAALDTATRRRLRLRATRSAAAILIQRQEEQLQSVTAPNGRTTLILQMSNNIFTQPEAAAAVLLGLDGEPGGET